MSPKVPREEVFRQLRASAPALVERWIAHACASPEEMPENFDVGRCIHLVLHAHVLPMGESETGPKTN